MRELLHWLDGKKTYICGTACAASYFAFSQGWIDTMTRDVLLSTFGLGTIAALRAGMHKEGGSWLK